MTVMAAAERNTELEDLWALVDELGSLSERLQKAAEAAMTSLNNEGEQKEKYR